MVGGCNLNLSGVIVALNTFDHVVEDLEDVWRTIERSGLRGEGLAIQLHIDRAIELANAASRKLRMARDAASTWSVDRTASAL